MRFRTCTLGSSCAAASGVAPVWDVTVFTKNRDRLLGTEVASKFFAAVLADPEVKPLLSSEYFSVAGTLIEAWASMKSFRPKDGSGAPPGPGRNGERDFHGEKRSDETHASTTDPDARLARKSSGQASKLCYAGHVVIENRHGLAVAATTTQETGIAERDAGEALGPGRNGERDFHVEKRSDETHASTMDPDARLARKSNGQASKLCYAGHVVIENRHGLAVAATKTRATRTAERDAGEAIMAGLDRAARSTLGGDKTYDTRAFVRAMGDMGVTPHVTQHTNGGARRSMDGLRGTRATL